MKIAYNPEKMDKERFKTILEGHIEYRVNSWEEHGYERMYVTSKGNSSKKYGHISFEKEKDGFIKYKGLYLYPTEPAYEHSLKELIDDSLSEYLEIMGNEELFLKYSGRIKVLPELQGNPKLNELLECVLEALRYFPELDGKEITIGLHAGFTVPYSNYDIYFRPESQPSVVKCSYKLANLVMRQEPTQHPKTAEYATIFGISRIPSSVVDSGEMNKIGDYPYAKGDLPQIAQTVLELKAGGLRTYVKKFKELCESYNEMRKKEIADSKPMNEDKLSFLKNPEL